MVIMMTLIARDKSVDKGALEVYHLTQSFAF